MYMNVKKTARTVRMLILLLCAVIPFHTNSIITLATSEQLNAEAEERKSNPVESNDVEGWPDGPLIGADAAILMDLDTGAVLYSKNINSQEYPASTTKIMTCLLAVENCDLNEIITVSQSAIDANASDGSNMGLVAGEQLTLEQILYGILINSANEGCNAVAEHVAGSMDAFVEMMNERAQELGCTNTHFVTTNGLHDENHYTTAHDLALIAREFFQYDILCQMSSTTSYVIEATDTNEEHYLKTHNKLYEGMEYEYPYLVGSKTGFTSNSRQCLVSCAEKDGMRLICVIMKEESPYQFEDTVNLFEYGFANFSKVNIAANETSFHLDQADFFASGDGLFGSTAQLITLDDTSTLVLPNGFSFDDLDSSITYVNSGTGLTSGSESGNNVMATVDYSYQSIYLGSANIVLNENALSRYTFSDQTLEESLAASESDKKIIDVRILIAVLAVIAVLGLGGLYVYVRIQNQKRRKNRRKGAYRGAPKGSGQRPGSRQGSKNGMRNLRSSGMRRISENRNVTDYAIGGEHAKVTPPKPKKEHKPSAFELKFQQLIDAVAGLSEAKRVEAAKQARRERERRMRERLREEAEQNRISGQSSIRSRRGQENSSAYQFDEPHRSQSAAGRRGSSSRYDEEPEYSGSSSGHSADPYERSSKYGSATGRTGKSGAAGQSRRSDSAVSSAGRNTSRSSQQRSRASYDSYDHYDNIETYEELAKHHKKSASSGKQKKSYSRYEGYTAEEIELMRRQEKRMQLAEKRRREMEDD